MIILIDTDPSSEAVQFMYTGYFEELIKNHPDHDSS